MCGTLKEVLHCMLRLFTARAERGFGGPDDVQEAIQA